MKTLLLLSILAMSTAAQPARPDFYPELLQYMKAASKEFGQIPAERQEALRTLARYVAQHIAEQQHADILFVCTGNSRRSHMGQVWAKAAALYYDVRTVNTFSGGLEPSAFNPRAIAALRRAGVQVQARVAGSNPIYDVNLGEGLQQYPHFSKAITEASNPSKAFCAVMVCSHAETACPVVHGAKNRVYVPYDDPKDFDGQPVEAAKYDERCRQIAREMLFVMAEAKKLM